jgi:hypothetical protein
MRPLNPYRRNRQLIRIPAQPQTIRQTKCPNTHPRRRQRPKMLMPIPRLRTILMILINAHPIPIRPLPLPRQPTLPRFRLSSLLSPPHLTPVMLIFSLELLDAGAAVDVVEAEFEDAVVEDAAFADVGPAATGAREVVAVVQPEFSLARGGVLVGGEDAAEGSALNVGVGVWVGSPEFDGVVDAHPGVLS